MPQPGQTAFWFARELSGMEMLRSNFLDPAYPRHMHNTFTVGVVDTGVVVNQSRGETRYLPQNSVYTFNPGDVHSGYAPEDVLISHRTFYPSEEALDELARDVGLRGAPYFKTSSFYAPQTAEHLRALHRLLEHSESALERESAVTEAFSALLTQHTPLLVGPRPKGYEPQAVKEVRDYLDAHFRTNVSLDELANLVSLNRAYLIRTFKRAVGIPPYTYLIQRRVEHAKRLLRTGVSPAQTALEVGFCDQSHLNLHFKRVMKGATPEVTIFQDGQKRGRQAGWMTFDTKIAVVVRDDLAVWQKLNVTAFTTSGIAGSYDILGKPFEDADGARYLPMIVQPVMVYEASAEKLRTVYERARSREVDFALYTEELFSTPHDEANRAAVKAVKSADLKLVGLAFRAERKVADKLVKGLSLHG